MSPSYWMPENHWSKLAGDFSRVSATASAQIASTSSDSAGSAAFAIPMSVTFDPSTTRSVPLARTLLATGSPQVVENQAPSLRRHLCNRGRPPPDLRFDYEKTKLSLAAARELFAPSPAATVTARIRPSSPPVCRVPCGVPSARDGPTTGHFGSSTTIVHIRIK